MRDRGLIYAGLLVFLFLITFPIWHNLRAGATAKGPEPALPKDVKQCVAPRAYMRNSHMDLLLAWRDDVVRRRVREYRSEDGKIYEMSLTKTCLGQCHTNKAEFCDRCHNYAAVTAYCWDCHVDPKLVARSGQ